MSEFQTVGAANRPVSDTCFAIGMKNISYIVDRKYIGFLTVVNSEYKCAGCVD